MLATPRERLVSQFRLAHAPELGARYNIAPSQPIASVRQLSDAGRELVFLHWGLIPSWAKQRSTRHRMINARAETLNERPAFRVPLARRRCLIPADGYYEWMASNGRKQPYFIRAKDKRLLALAGLWERWQHDQEAIESCAIITTESNGPVRDIHDRMPLILPERAYDQWLDPSVQDPTLLRPLLEPFDAVELMAYPVSPRVNSPRVDDAACVAPLDEQQRLL